MVSREVFSGAIVPAPSEMVVPHAGATVSQGFGSMELSAQAEMQAQSQAATARALVEARFVMAERRPRNFALARKRLLEDCQRPGFADSAIYSKPQGNTKIEGLSIRFAEAAARALTNIHSSVQVIWDDPDRRVIHIEATDLETNTTFSDDVILEKTVERSRAEGREVVRERRNSRGLPVFVVRANEDELLMKQAALASKRIRNCLLRLVPGDLVDEARAECERTIAREAQMNLPAKRQKMAVAFAQLERPVLMAELSAYLGHSPEQATVQEITELQRIYVALRDGESTWAEVMASTQPERTLSAPAPASTKEPSPATVPQPEPTASDGRRDEGSVSPPEASAVSESPAMDYAVDALGVVASVPGNPVSKWDELELKMNASQTVRELKKLSMQFAGAPPEERERVRGAYEKNLERLSAKT